MQAAIDNTFSRVGRRMPPSESALRPPFSLLLLAVGLLLPGARVSAAVPWAVEGATLRVQVEVSDPPSDPAAGVLAILPDGGLLPRPVPDATVLSSEGETLVSQTLWHNAARGYAVAFLATGKVSQAWIYLRGISQSPSETLNRGLHPSLLLYTRPGPPELDKARRLPGLLPEKTETVMGPIANICLSDNPWGPHDFFHSYASGWIRRARAGRVYFCTISRDESELRVDGRTVAEWPANRNRQDGAKGQFGSWVELTAGLHRLEYVHVAGGGGKELQAAWKIPGETPGDLPVAIPASAYLHSGLCRILRAEFRDGRPAFAIDGARTPSRYFWFGEQPLNLYELRANPLGNTTNDTTFTWIFDADRRMTWPHATWIFPGGTTNTVTCVAVNRRGTTKVVTPLLVTGDVPRGAINSRTDRAWFRAVLLSMCESTAPGKSPCSRWTPDFWETLMNIAVPFEGPELLETIFTRSRRETLALERGKRWTLEDVFIGGLRGSRPDQALSWAERFEKEETDAARRFALKQDRFDLTLYDLADTVAARGLAGDLKSAAQTPEQRLRAMIRLADVERAVSNLEAAVTLYGDAQDRYHEQLRQRAPSPLPEPTVKDLRRAARPRLLSTRAYARAPGRDWRTLAVRESSFYASVSGLTEGGYLFEARDLLRQWELEVPLSKIGGDYPLAEAEYYLAAGSVRRALAGLRLYRGGMDISGALPDVMDLELRCLVQLERRKEAEALAGEILKQFPNHPAADRARKTLGQ